ncbi:hypothetical protein EJB05_28967, partial [Eragrostis curvula]
MTCPSSLKRLIMEGMELPTESRMRICAPGLVSLRLLGPRGRTPVLESMPELLAAHVVVDWDSEDTCDSCSQREGDEGAEQFADDDNISQDTKKCVLLGGLSEATDLILISEDSRKGLEMVSHIFKLKTLLLNDYWCYPADCRPLGCILEHAPVLEKLTVLFSCEVEDNYKVEMEGRLDRTERSVAISHHLKIIKVKCEVVDEGVYNLLKFMGALNIY